MTALCVGLQTTASQCSARVIHAMNMNKNLLANGWQYVENNDILDTLGT